jgi:uncharacterized protein
MKVFMIIFVLLTAVILIGGHAFLYFSWIKLFGIVSLTAKKVLAIALGILSISFIITTLLTYWQDNVIVDYLYLAASAWLGIMWYIFLATGAMWIMYGIGRLANVTAAQKIGNGILLALAVAYSIYGLWNAQRPIIKSISVTIPNLPASWQGRTAVQISDIHLGPINGIPFFQKVIKQIQAINPDIVFITGDLFDGGSHYLGDLAEPIDELKPPLGVYFVTGNHETYIDVNKAIDALKNTNVTILRDQVINVDGVQLLGVDYPLPGQKKDFTSIADKLDRSRPNIVLYHEPAHLDIFRQAGANLLLSGHTHVGQVWPFNYITQAVYHGYDYGLHTEGVFSQYTSSGTGTWGPPMRTGNRPEIVKITFK